MTESEARSLDLESFYALLQLSGSGRVSLEQVVAEHATLLGQLTPLDPLRAASTFGGLLALPALQSNCLRLEMLTHFALAIGQGTQKPSNDTVRRAFNRLQHGTCGRFEDPAEDVFTTNIATPRGNFRVLEGIWESAGFYLQRTLDTMESMPLGGDFDLIRESVYSLLGLSDLLCHRSGLQRYELGNPTPLDTLPSNLAAEGARARRRVRFTEFEMEAAGISLSALSPFLFPQKKTAELLKAELGNTLLERHPLALRGSELFFLLPTAVSVSIRRFIIERVDNLGLRGAFIQALGREYARSFSDAPLLGGSSGAPIAFRATSKGAIATCVKHVDEGRYLQLVFFLDNLAGFESEGFSGLQAELPTDEITQVIARGRENFSKRPDFTEGLTLIVGCGLGRGAAFPLTNSADEAWGIEFVSAPDLWTLSWTPEFRPLSLWRLLQTQGRLEQEGVGLQNMNGLLNLVAWARHLEGHLVPHGALPDDFVREDSSSNVVIEQNGLLRLRHEVALACDHHVEPYIDGSFRPVSKVPQTFFEEDRGQALYLSRATASETWPLGAYVTGNRPWWCEVELASGASGQLAYQRGQMLSTWIVRAAPVLENALPRLPDGPLRWVVSFAGVFGESDGQDDRRTAAEVDKDINTTVDFDSRSIHVRVGQVFEDAIFHEENVAERGLVRALIDGACRLARADFSNAAKQELCSVIVPDHLARQAHAFRTREFRHFVKTGIDRSPINIDRGDDAGFRLGLGWSVRDRALGGGVEGKVQCIAFLRKLIKRVEIELCEDLRLFRKAPLIRSCLMNHEAAVVERDVWRRTAGANLSLRSNKPAVMAAILSQEAKLNATSQSSRGLIEFALCECPEVDGREAGELDLSRLMTKVALLFHVGGWEGAIRWDAMQPKLRVTPLGDVHANFGFIDEVIEPFGRVGSERRITRAIANYARNLEDVEITASTAESISVEFQNAWWDQFGITIDQFRGFIDSVEDLAIREGAAVISRRRSEIISVAEQGRGLDSDVAGRIVDALTFPWRPRWHDVPTGYSAKDLQPWRFRRQATVLCKPILPLQFGPDPLMAIAPGILRDGFSYMVSNYYRGDFPDWQLKGRMAKWAGSAADERGRAFSKEVGEHFESNGWDVRVELKITKIFGRSLDRDYGDVDVLAWNKHQKRILVIECKDVHYRKTAGEIAEQVADFRGELNEKGKPDYLLKHLTRFDLLSEHSEALSRLTGIRGGSVESHLLFKNPVPMQFALERLGEQVAVTAFSEISSISQASGRG